MVWAKPKFIWEDVDRHGNVRVYFCRQGQRKIRIHAIPNSPEFWVAYAAAAQGCPLPVPGKEQRRTRAARERSAGSARPISPPRNTAASTQARKWFVAA